MLAGGAFREHASTRNQDVRRETNRAEGGTSDNNEKGAEEAKGVARCGRIITVDAYSRSE